MPLTSKQRNNLSVLTLLVFFCLWAGIAILRQNKLKHNHVVGMGQIYDYSSGGRGNAGGIWIDYRYEINKKKYTGSSRYLTTEIEYRGLNHFIDKSFPIIYNPSNPSISSLMLLPKDFTKNGYTFPDSLNWTLQYLKDPK
ncbi:MAG TPA: hypothetical protein VGG71_08155 [Chitinophagaceae bacterium]|jgi:hypothetical protein